MNSRELMAMKNEIDREAADARAELSRGVEECARVRNVLHNTRAILDNLDEEFSRRTGLTGMDISFLFVAVGLQVLRQYLVTRFPERLDDQEAAKRTFGHREEHSDRKHRLYNPSLEEILTNPVPFDAIIGSDGALKGGGKMGHRVTAIGHDPILGLVFGTANIATSTLTTSSMRSYHIYTNDQKRDCFKNKARTDLVLGKTADKLLYGGSEGRVIVGASLIKEIIHLRTDLYTKNSLPMPIVSVLNAEKAAELAGYGLDMANIVTAGKQAAYAVLINAFIAMAHGFFCDGETEMDKKLYEVRTRKILTVSNFIATTSNLIVTAVTEDLRNLDLGGLVVTIYRIATDRRFIQQVKREFIFEQYKDIIKGKDF